MKRFALGLLVAAISGVTYAAGEVIELDAVNPDHCRQQILSSSDELPIIATYSSNRYDDTSPDFLKKLEVIAKEHPEKTFFKWDEERDLGHLTKTLCMQQYGFSIAPSVMMVGVIRVSEFNSFISSPLRLSWARNMSLADLNKFIDVSDFDVKKALRTQGNRHR